MKKRLIALLLVLALLIPAGIASAATWYRVNTSSLKVRFLPDDSAKVLGSYRKDYACTVSSTKNGWSYVTFSNGTEGYVQSKYISKASTYKAWVTKDDTSLRKGPDGNFDAIASLAKGTKVSVLSHGSKYDYVSAGDLGSGYIMNGLLSKAGEGFRKSVHFHCRYRRKLHCVCFQCRLPHCQPASVPEHECACDCRVSFRHAGVCRLPQC